MADLKYLFVHRDQESSVYNEVKKFLLRRPDKSWRKVGKESSRFHLMLGDRNKLPYSKLCQVLGLTQLVNYYRGSDVICRKVSMVRTIKDYCEKKQLRMFEWLPTSFVIYPPLSTNGNRLCDEVAPSTRTRTDERQLLLRASQQNKDAVWIAKSSSGSKGEGIVISQSVDELLHLIDGQSKSYIIQQYIDRPMLLPGKRKFDIRCWVLLDATYTIYMYREGVLRTTSESYRPDDLGHVTSHLTNHALQKDLSENFGKYEEGNEMFYEEFDRFLQSEYGMTLGTCILPQIRTIVKTCLNIIQSDISTKGLSYWSFQLFGFDFMVDEDVKVWLLEVNGAPACAQKLLPGLVESLVETAIDPVFTPYAQVQYGENLFQQIG